MAVAPQFVVPPPLTTERSQVETLPRGQRFLIRSDHQALAWIYSTTDSSGRLMRWRLRLSDNTIGIQYKPGASQHVPDILSRTNSSAPIKDIDDDIPCLALAETAKGLLTGRYTGTDLPDADFDDIFAAQQTDTPCMELASQVTKGKAVALFLQDGHVLYTRAPNGNQLAIPTSFRELLLLLEHYATVAARPGLNRMYYAMRRRHY